MSNKLTIFGSAFKYGQAIDGVQKAPSLISSLGISNKLITLGNKVRHYGIIHPELRDTPGRTLGLYAANLARKVYQERVDGRRILNIGGDHTVAIGSINGILEHDPSTIVLYIDAKPDLNILASGLDLNHMVVSFLTGRENYQISQSKYLRPKLNLKNMAFIGVRDMCKCTTRTLESNNALYWCSDFINRSCGKTIINHTLDQLDPHQTRPIHVSLDMNVFGKEHAPGCGTLVKGNVNPNDVFSMLDTLRMTKRVVGMDVVEVNPLLDPSGKTVKLAMSCMERLFDNKT